MPLVWGALLAMLVVGLLMLVLRWGLSEYTALEKRRKDYGLLTEVAVVPTKRAADVVSDQLKRHGVKATAVPDTDGERLRILVFPADEQTAVRALLDENQ
jgi:hypothetical protein